MSSEKGQKHIYAQEHQLYYHYNNFRGHSQKESKTVEYKAIAIFSVNAAGIASAFILLYKSFRCHKNVKRKTLAKHRKLNFVQRIFASSFKRKITEFCKQQSLTTVKITCN